MTGSETPATSEEYDEQVDRLNQSINILVIETDNGGPGMAERYRNVIAGLQTRRTQLADRADRIRKSSDDASREVGDAAEQAIAELKSEIAALESRVANVRADMAAELATDIATLKSDIATVRADVAAELATDIATYRKAAKTQIAAWRTYIDQLTQRVKRRTTGAQTKTREALDNLEEAYQGAKHELGEAGETTGETLATLKTQGKGVVDHLRKAARELNRSLD
ncbi:MAG: hypothetical protein U9N78_00245 [Actinomycetota bacterium]|nr:hypothetical protein [Actinomycetota bacterium]